MALTKVQAAGLTADLIDETKLADNSIDSEHYNDGSIDNAHLADDAVGVDELSATGTAGSTTYLRGDNTWTVPPDTNTQLSTEAVQDIIGAMFTGNTETNISATYEDSDGTIDLVSTDTNTQLTEEQVEDFVGGMVTGNTETGITVTYEDSDGTLDFVVASQTDENFTTADHSKLDGIATSANNYVHPNHSGDVTSSADGATTIAAGAVDIAMLAAGTDGKIITWDANGAPTVVGPGTDGQVLTSTGAGSPPAFEDAAGGVDGISSSADANAITIDSSEHVIVGGTTVSNVHTNNQDFVVGNSSNSVTGMALNCASGGYCSIVMSDSAGDKNKGLIAYNHADDTLKICNDPASGSDGLVLQSSHDVKISSGDLLFGTAGKGVVLGATSNTDANTLDDYEEGTWTPADNSGTDVSLWNASGCYTKIGNIVHVQAYFGSLTSGTMAVDDLIQIQGLPFSRDSSIYPPAQININYNSSNGSVVSSGTVNSTPAITARVAVTTGHNRSGPGYYVDATYRVA